nr:hypothetical protein [Tanacetum cinerariifolium]
MDDPNITTEEYIRLEEEKAHRNGKVYNWETTTYGKIWYNEDVHNLKSVETEFPAIVFDEAFTFDVTPSYEPTCMRTLSSSNLVGESSPNPTTSNLKRRNCRLSKQPFILEESPVDTMADQRTLAELLRAPTEGYAEPIVGLPVVGSKKNPLVLFSLGKILFPNSSMNSFLPQERQISEMKFLTFNNGLMNHFIRHGIVTRSPSCMPSSWFYLIAPTRYLLQCLKPCRPRFFEFCRRWQSFGKMYSRCVNDYQKQIQAKLTHAANQQTSDVTTAMTAIFKQFQGNPPPTPVKVIEEIYVTCGGAQRYYPCLAADGNSFPEFRDNIQGHVLASAINYNQGNSGYRPSSVASQI